MLIHYVEAMETALQTLWGWATSSAGISLMTLAVAALLLGAALAFKRDPNWLRVELLQRGARWSLGWVGVLVVVTLGWFGLGAVYRVAQIDERWREGAVAVTDPLPSGAPIVQLGPALAAIGERTYTRSLRLPPQFLAQLGEEGVGVLAPYIQDPTAENVLRLRDKFRRSGREVVFTREATVRAEEPLSFSAAAVKVAFLPLGNRVYDAAFEARYTWSNPGPQAREVRFTFPLPQVGTLRDLRVDVDGQAVPQAEDASSYEWQDVMKPGQIHSASVIYRAVGARAWNYNLGSQRRRVQQFGLAASGLRAPRFGRGGLLPTRRGGNVEWKLDNVVTAQQVALVWPEDYSAPALFTSRQRAAIGAIGVRARRAGTGILCAPRAASGEIIGGALGFRDGVGRGDGGDNLRRSLGRFGSGSTHWRGGGDGDFGPQICGGLAAIGALSGHVFERTT